MNSQDGKLTLHFNEPVQGSLVTLSQITIQARASASSASYSLTTGVSQVKTGVSTTQVISLGYADSSAIKIAEALAVSANSSWLSFETATFFDTAAAENSANTIYSTDATAVATYTADTTRCPSS